MARQVYDTNLATRSARLRLPADEYHWRTIDQGAHIGYRRGARSSTWIARFRLPAGKYTEMKIGSADDVQDADGTAVLTFSQAQAKANAWFVEQRAKAAGKPTTSALTVSDACDRYVAYLEAERKSSKDADQRIRKHVTPVLGNRPVADLTLTELEEWRNGLVKRDPDDPDVERRSKDTANRLLNYLKGALNRAMRDPSNGLTDDRAWRLLKPFEKVGVAREVHLDKAQVTRLINKTAGGFRRLVVGALLTGCRAGELKAMRVGDFNRATGTLRVRGGKTGARDVVLTSEGTRFFGDITAGRHPDDVLFVRDDGSAWNKDDHHRPMAAATESAKLPADTVFYSLRHTYASQCLMAGMNVQLLAENMGTSVAMIERHYGKFTKIARRKQIEASAPKLGLAPDSKVTELRRKIG